MVSMSELPFEKIEEIRQIAKIYNQADRSLLTWENLGIEELFPIINKYNSILSQELGINCYIVPVGSILHTKLFDVINDSDSISRVKQFSGSSDIDIIVIIDGELDHDIYSETIERLNIQNNFNNELQNFNIKACDILNFGIKPLDVNNICNNIKFLEKLGIQYYDGRPQEYNIKAIMGGVSQLIRAISIGRLLYQNDGILTESIQKLIELADRLDKTIDTFENPLRDYYQNQIPIFSHTIGQYKQLVISLHEVMRNPMPRPKIKNIIRALNNPSNEIVNNTVLSLQSVGIQVLEK